MRGNPTTRGECHELSVHVPMACYHYVIGYSSLSSEMAGHDRNAAVLARGKHSLVNNKILISCSSDIFHCSPS